MARTGFFPNGSVVSDDGQTSPSNVVIISGVGITYNRASLKLIPFVQRTLIVFLFAPEAGVQKAYTWNAGSTATPDDYSVIDPGDGTGMWIQYL